MVETGGECDRQSSKTWDVRQAVGYRAGGTELYPLCGGLFRQIDARTSEDPCRSWKTDYERPILFWKLGDGYVCLGELHGSQLLLSHHHQGAIRQFKYGTRS